MDGGRRSLPTATHHLASDDGLRFAPPILFGSFEPDALEAPFILKTAVLATEVTEYTEKSVRNASFL